MAIAYWQKPNGERAAYEFEFKIVPKGRKGYWEYQAAMGTIMQVNDVLRDEGYELHYD